MIRLLQLLANKTDGFKGKLGRERDCDKQLKSLSLITTGGERQIKLSQSKLDPWIQETEMNHFWLNAVEYG